MDSHDVYQELATMKTELHHSQYCAMRNTKNALWLASSLNDYFCSCSESRYLLVLTENYAALRIIQQELLKEEDDAVVIFGSSFPKDQEYTQVLKIVIMIITIISRTRVGYEVIVGYFYFISNKTCIWDNIQ